MALIHCNECGKEISDQATVCPNCGAKTQTWFNNQQLKKIKRKNIWNIVTIAFLSLITLACFGFTFVFLYTTLHFMKSGEMITQKLPLILLMILCIIASVVICKYISKKSTVKIQRTILAVYCVYILGAILFFSIGFITEVKPCWDFQKLYCNENAIENLQDKEISWGDIKLTFEGNDITFVGKDNQVTLPIDTISEDGTISVKVTPEQLAAVFGDFKGYFKGEKVSDKWYDIDKYTSCLSLSPWQSHKKYNIFYSGYYAREPEIIYKGTLDLSPTFIGITQGIQEGAYAAARSAINAAKSIKYDDSKAGLFRFSVKIDASSGYLQPRTVPINTTTSTPHTQELITDKIDEEEIKPDSASIEPNNLTFDEIQTTDNRHPLVGKTFKVMDKGDGYSISFTSENDVFVCTMGDYDAYCSGQYSIQDNGDIFVYFGVDDSLPFQLSDGKTENLNCFTLSKDGWLYVNEGDRRINLFKYTKF